MYANILGNLRVTLCSSKISFKTKQHSTYEFSVLSFHNDQSSHQNPQTRFPLEIPNDIETRTQEFKLHKQQVDMNTKLVSGTKL